MRATAEEEDDGRRGSSRGHGASLFCVSADRWSDRRPPLTQRQGVWLLEIGIGGIGIAEALLELVESGEKSSNCGSTAVS